MMLGDLGARVIKVESPAGDDSRWWGPPFVGPEDEPESTYFLSANRNKESVTADLKSEAGRAFLTRLVARADVLMENFRTGVLDRLGFSVERLHEINPRLVVLSITGFGHDGPEGGRAGYDQIAQGEAGLMSLTGPSAEEPTRVGRADRRPAGRDVRRVRRPRRAARAGDHRSRPRRADLAARVGGGRARLPGHPLDGRPRGPARARQPPPVDRSLRPVPRRRRAGADRLRHRAAVDGGGGPARDRGRPLRHEPVPRRAPRRAGRGHRGGAGVPARRGLAGAAGRARRARPARCARSTTCTPGTRRGRRGC